MSSFCEALDEILESKEEQTAEDYFNAMLNAPIVHGVKVLPAYCNGKLLRDYYATDKGDIISIKRGIKFLSKWKQSKGYHQVDLSIGGKPKKLMVHRIIYESFHCEDIRELQVDHIDRDRVNNALDNLRALTVAANNHNKRGSSLSVWAVNW